MKFLLINLWFYLILMIKKNEVEASGGRVSVTKKTKCLNPPRTARRVELYINECQDEVRTKLVSEAFQILKDKFNEDHKIVIDAEPTYNDESPVEYYEYINYPNHYGDHSLPSKPPSVIDIASYDTITETDKKMPSKSDTKNNFNVYESTNPEAIFETNTKFRRSLQNIKRTNDLTIGVYHPTLVPFEDKRIAGCLLHCIYAKNKAIDKLGWPTLDGLVEFYSEGVNEHGFFMATLRAVNLCLHAVTKKYHVNRRLQPEGGESCDLAFDVFDCISDQITGYCLDNYKQ